MTIIEHQIYIIEQDIIFDVIRRAFYEVFDEDIADYIFNEHIDYTSLESFLRANCLDFEESDEIVNDNNIFGKVGIDYGNE